MSRRTLRPRALLSRLAAVCAALVAGTVAAACQQKDEDWNHVFHRSEGWWYSDGGSSAALSDGKTVWFFGDTWLRNERDVLFNSMAVQDSAPGKAPRSGEIRFFARARDGLVRDVTHSGRLAARSWAEPVGSGAGSENTWLWPSAALEAGGQLIAMYIEVRCVVGEFPACRESLGNMGFAGHSVLVVDNPLDDPARWRTSTTALRDRRGASPSDRSLHWGSALLEEGGWLYVFGASLDESSRPEDVKLARTLPRDVTRYDHWQFLTPRGFEMIPTGPSAAELETVARGGATELSVHRVVRDGSASIVMVHMDIVARELVVRAAPDGALETARWAAPDAVDSSVRRFAIGPLDPETAAGMSWSGRAHPQHSRGDRLLVSYFSEHLHSLRFAEVPLPGAREW